MLYMPVVGSPLARRGPRTGVAAILAALVFSIGIPASASTPPSYLGTLAGLSANVMYPSGLTYDAHLDRLVLADTGLDHIDIYTMTGQPFKSFGGVGTGNGQFQSPRDAAVDSLSNIYVADAENSRIQKFDSNGVWQWTVGAPKACTGSACLNVPIGISFDLTNNVAIVADTGHSLIKAFTPSGALAWTSPAPSTTGIASPRDAVRGPDGRIWVADYQHQEVKAFNVTAGGAWSTPYALKLGDGKAGGHLLGELNFPYNVRFSPDGRTAYVADTGNERVARWDISVASSPQPLSEFGSRCPTPCPAPPGNAGYFLDLRRVDVDRSGNVWAADFWGSGLREFSPSGTVLQEIAGSVAPTSGFAEAFGVAVGPDGTTYVVDRLNQRVERFDSKGHYLNSQGQRGAAPGAYSWPESVAVAPDRTVWVADSRGDRMFHFPADLSGSPAVIGSTGKGLGQFSNIDGVSVDAAGNVWAADTTNNRVQSYNPSTGVFTAFGTRGRGAGQFIAPQGVVASGSAIYVADTGNNRVEKLDLQTGAYLGAYSSGLSGPEGITLAPDGSVWVADTQNARVVHLDANLNNLNDGFGSCGSSTPPPPAWPECANGPTNLYLPHSVAVAGTVLFVADTFNNRVQEINIAGA